MPDGDDTYPSMTALYADLKLKEGINYTKEWYMHRWRYKTSGDYKKKNEVFIMAPHGGGIETGTTELALATAGFTDDFNAHPATSKKYDYFIFNGTNSKEKNDELHVTASNYDDPVANELVKHSLISLAFHGCTDEQPKQSTGEGYKACLIGGLDKPFKKILDQRIDGAGFKAIITTQESLNGDMPENIINKNRRSEGAQFELTTSFRKSLFGTDTRYGRRMTTNPDFWRFVNIIRECIELYRFRLSI
jgi:phage replication-related protein YjqB (UPF0714/DUF867 family)